MAVAAAVGLSSSPTARRMPSIPKWPPPSVRRSVIPSVTEVPVTEATDRLVCRLQRLLEAVATSSRGAQGAERRRAETGRRRAGAEGVGDREPGAVTVLDEIEPVAADLVRGEQTACELGAGDARDPRRKEVCWISAAGVGGFRGRAASEVGVVVRELERSGPLLGDVVERRHRCPDAEEDSGHPAEAIMDVYAAQARVLASNCPASVGQQHS
jgi:hypothetical protein